MRGAFRLFSKFAVAGGLLLFCCAAPGASPQFVPGQILVRPKAQLPEPEFSGRLRTHGAIQRQALRHLNVRVLHVPEERTEAVLKALRHDPGIEFAERDGIARAAFVPSDPYVVSGAEWHLARIQAPPAWNLTTGSAQTVVAVLDSGINAAHPDLAGKILPGYDFVWNDSEPADDFGHGTAVAGVVVAAGNNGVGVAGIAYGCSVLPVKVMDAAGFASYSCLAQGIKYAVDQGARIINVSIAGSSPSTTLQDAIDYAWSNNVVIVAAAGNNSSSVLQYPAACEHVVAVSATEPDDSLAPFSSYGNWVTVAAPGDNIWTTQRDLSNPYGPWRGTSFASPAVAAVAALMLSANPSLSNTQLVSLLEQGADDVGAAGYDSSFGYGRVNALRAVSVANPELAAANPALVVPPTIGLTSPTNGAAFEAGTALVLAATASASTGAMANVTFLTNGGALGMASTAPFTFAWIPAQPGNYALTAVATDSQGLSTTSAPTSILIRQPETGVPTVRLTESPPNGARLFTPVISLAGTATDNAGVDHVEIQVNGGPVQVAAGATNWSARVVLSPGPNAIQVRSVDLAGKVSPNFTRVFTYVVLSSLSVQTNGLGRVSPNLNGRLLEIGRSYTIRAVPGPDQLFAGWDGAPSPGPLLTFVMKSNLNLTAYFVATPFPVVKGAYAGLVANTNGVTPGNSGYFTLAVTRMGRFSGRLYSGGHGYSFLGQFDLGGDATASVRRNSLSPLTLRLHVDLLDGTDVVSGSVTDGGWASTLEGDRNVFNARWNPAQQAGVRDFVLEPADNAETAAATGASRISTSGSARVRGKLSDGRAFGTASSLARNGDCPFYLSLNRGSEVVIGWLNFPAGPAPLANGTVLWVKTGTNAFAATLTASAAK